MKQLTHKAHSLSAYGVLLFTLVTAALDFCHKCNRFENKTWFKLNWSIREETAWSIWEPVWTLHRWV